VYASTPVRQYASTPVRQYASTPVRQYASTPVRQFNLLIKVRQFGLFFFFFLLYFVGISQVVNDPVAGANSGWNQNIMPPSPNSAALGKYGDIPVSAYTGIPSISIPLHNLAGNQLSVPLSLSYHAGGIKVEEMASNVGLGWSLNAGGVITRTVRGRADEGPMGYMNNNFQRDYLPSQANIELLRTAKDNNWDTEPDQFFFNVGGYSGKFFLNPNWEVKFENATDVKIEHGGTADWTMTTPDGVRYYFGGIGRNNVALGVLLWR
jgi:hypothetical protein